MQVIMVFGLFVHINSQHLPFYRKNSGSASLHTLNEFAGLECKLVKTRQAPRRREKWCISILSFA